MDASRVSHRPQIVLPATPQYPYSCTITTVWLQLLVPLAPTRILLIINVLPVTPLVPPVRLQETLNVQPVHPPFCSSQESANPTVLIP